MTISEAFLLLDRAYILNISASSARAYFSDLGSVRVCRLCHLQRVPRRKRRRRVFCETIEAMIVRLAEAMMKHEMKPRKTSDERIAAAMGISL